MRRQIAAALVMCVVPVSGQPARRYVPQSEPIRSAEAAVKGAMLQLTDDKKVYDRDLEVLTRIHAAADALADTMQPHNAIQKALDEMEEAKRLRPPAEVMEGVLKACADLENARRDPAEADFNHIRGTIRSDAAGPAARVVARNALKMQDDILGWIKIQELISNHLRALTEISAASAHASEQ